MGYVLLADVLAFLHLAILFFVFFGQVLIMVGWLCGWTWIRNPWFRVVHLATIGVVVYEALIGMQCPLTIWEFQLRTLGGQPASDYSFTARVVHFFIFWADKNFDDPNLVWSYYVFGGLVLAMFVLAPPRWRSRKAATPEALEGQPSNAVRPATE